MARTPYPVDFFWDGKVMTPCRPYAATRQYVEGEIYRLAVHEDRSNASHNHYFAAVHDAWQNLPESLAPEYPTADHLRKRALIKAGYYDERHIVCATDDEALKVAAFIKPMDEYAAVLAKGNVVRVFTAKSQSTKAMGKKDFQDSKDKVLQILADLIGVKASQLTENAGKAA